MRLFALPVVIALLCACGPVEITDEELVVFVDPESDFATSDVHDVERDLVQFTTSGRLVIDGLGFSGWPAAGNELRSFGDFVVRFGDEQGERRAFFTEANPGTLCDLEVDGFDLLIFSTDELVPSNVR